MELPQTENTRSADEAKQNMKNKVASGVATVVGALEGFVEEAKKNDLPRKSKETIQKAGETARSASDAAREQIQKFKNNSGSGPGGRMSRSERRAARQKEAYSPSEEEESGRSEYELGRL